MVDGKELESLWNGSTKPFIWFSVYLLCISHHKSALFKAVAASINFFSRSSA